MIKEYKINTDVERLLDYDEDIVEYIVPYQIETLEGTLEVHVDDWIATGINGEHWVIRDDIFRKTYEEVK